MLGTEVERGHGAEAEGAVEFPFAEHADGEPEAHLVGLRYPLRPCGGVDVAVVDELRGLVVNAHEEAVVETALVDEGLVLDLALLGKKRRGAECKAYQEDAEQRNHDLGNVFI